MADKPNKKEIQEELDLETQENVNDTLSAGTFDFIKKYQQYIYIGLGVLVLAIAGVVFFNEQQKSKNEEAFNEMFHATQQFEADSIDLALNGRAGEFMGLQEIADDYGSTDAGNLAKYYVGVGYLQQGRLDEGLDALESFSKGDNLLSMAAYSALAFGYEDKGDVSKAANYFEKAANTPSANDRYTPYLLMQAARCYETLNEPDKARKLYEKIRDQYPLSAEGSRVEKYLARVKS